MTRNLRRSGIAALLAAGVALAPAARADFEVSGPDGRKILLRDDGTWQYRDAAKNPAGADKEDGRRERGEAVLSLVRAASGTGSTCQFVLRLENNLSYEIQSLVPTFRAHRANGVAYDSVSSGFLSIKPGGSKSTEIQFRGIDCRQIARLQVAGGDRCVMGDLDRWSPSDGACLKRVRVLASELVRFEK